jgi:hypothetical protein
MDGASPFPLYTCLHAKKDVPASEFHEWIEFSPYEIGLPKYGVSVKTEDFGSRFYIGSIIEKYPEPRLTYLQGGSFVYYFNIISNRNVRIAMVPTVCTIELIILDVGGISDDLNFIYCPPISFSA